MCVASVVVCQRLKHFGDTRLVTSWKGAIFCGRYIYIITWLDLLIYNQREGETRGSEGLDAPIIYTYLNAP